jgi:hypothetical protein
MPVEPPVQANIADLDIRALVSGRTLHHSPTAWEDEVLYFLMLDRFSDGKEAGFRGIDGAPVPAGAGQTTPVFRDGDASNAITNEMDAAAWRDAGGRWCGGTLKGLETKLGYLKRLGITAIWISPIFKQVSFQPTNHGYGIQNYLDVDPHFGSRTDLRELVPVDQFFPARYADFARPIFESFAARGLSTRKEDVADAIWAAAHEVTGQRRFLRRPGRRCAG